MLEYSGSRTLVLLTSISYVIPLPLFQHSVHTLVPPTPRQCCQDVMKNVGVSGSPIFVNVDYASGRMLNNWVDSLSASFAGVQVWSGTCMCLNAGL